MLIWVLGQTFTLPKLKTITPRCWWSKWVTGTHQESMGLQEDKGHQREKTDGQTGGHLTTP